MTYFPAPPPYFPVRPAGHGFMAHHIKEVKQQVYAELQSERAGRSGSRTSSKTGYSHKAKNTQPQYTPSAKKASRNSYILEPLITFPTPQVIVYPSGPRFFGNRRPSPQLSTLAQHLSPAWDLSSTSQPQIRFPTPEPYVHDIPLSYPSQIPYTPPDGPSKPHRLYQSPAQVMPFPDPDEAMPLLSYPPPSMFTSSSSASTYGSTSYHSSLSSTSPSRTRRRRLNGDTVVRAAEQMKICKQQTAEWANLIRQHRTEKLSTEDHELSLLVKGLHQKASTALKMILALTYTVTGAQYAQYEAQISSRKITADLSLLATLTTTLQHKLASLARRLKDAKMMGREKPPGIFSRIENAPGCVAGLYLKHRLLRFTSLLRAQEEDTQYTELDSKDRLPMSRLASLLYSEVQRTYGTASNALTGFQSSLHALRLELEAAMAPPSYIEKY